MSHKEHKTWTKVRSGKSNFFLLRKAEYKPHEITPPIIIRSPLLKLSESKISSLSFVTIARIPPTEIIRPKIWNLFVFYLKLKKLINFKF